MPVRGTWQSAVALHSSIRLCTDPHSRLCSASYYSVESLVGEMMLHRVFDASNNNSSSGHEADSLGIVRPKHKRKQYSRYRACCAHALPSAGCTCNWIEARLVSTIASCASRRDDHQRALAFALPTPSAVFPPAQISCIDAVSEKPSHRKRCRSCSCSTYCH